MRRMACTVVAPVFIYAVYANVLGGSSSQNGPVVWHPPKLQYPEALPPSSTSKEMITTLRVGGVPVVLEKTELEDIQKRLPGGSIGGSGDASEAIAWLCFYGTDSNGPWALWLESSEIAGLRWIDGFALQRLSPNSKMDLRCRRVTEAEGGIELPVALRLGQTEAQVRKILGKPAIQYRGTLVFSHEHYKTVRNEVVTVSNSVDVALRDGIVWSIQVWKDSTR